MDTSALYRQLLDTLQAGYGAQVISVYGADGSVRKRLASTADSAAWQQALALAASPQAVSTGPVTSIAASDGSLTVLENYTAHPRLVILGAGHVALALAHMASLVDFKVVVFDDRPSFANTQRFPDAEQVICDSFTNFIERVSLRGSDYVVVVTRGHKHDAHCLAGILAGPEPAYTGMIGSHRRVAIVMNRLRHEGYDADRIERIHSPIGLKIGAVTPAEIAISIMAQIIEVKRLERSEGLAASCDLEAVEAIAAGSVPAEAMITIYNSTGSVPIDCGAKLALSYDGQIVGTIGGGCSEAEAMTVARQVIREGGWRSHTIDMSESAEEDGMVCGGQMQVVIEAIEN